VSLPFSESVKSIALFLLLAIFLVQIYRKEMIFKITILHIAFLGLMVSAFISSMLAENMAKGLKGFYDITYYSIAFFVAASVSDEKQSRVILWGLYVSTAAAVVMGIAHAIQTHGSIEIHQLRNPNYIAMYLIIVLCCMISTLVLSNKETIVSKVIVGILALIVLWGAILTEYRSSFIGLVTFIFILLFAKSSIKHSLVTGVALLSVCLSGVFLYKPLWNKLTTTQSLIARFYLWDGAFNYFKTHPLFGIGPNHYSYLHPEGSPTAGGINIDAHSIYLNTLAQMGLAGFVSLSLLIYGFIREFSRERTMTGFGISLKYCALGAFLVTFAGGIFDSTLHHGHGILFGLLLGLFAGNAREMLPGQKPEGPDN
jgi:O-antigen ligase